MVVLLSAQTLPINPEGATPVLTIEKIWKGMVIKCRKPQLFVEPMSHCEVLHEDEKGLTRRVTFKEGMGPPSGTVEERVEYFEPMKADFFMETGSKVSNIISQGPNGDHDLWMTFTFEWPEPKIEAGSQEAKDKNKQYNDMGLKTIQHTIDVIRNWVRKGEL